MKSTFHQLLVAFIIIMSLDGIDCQKINTVPFQSKDPLFIKPTLANSENQGIAFSVQCNSYTSAEVVYYPSSNEWFSEEKIGTVDCHKWYFAHSEELRISTDHHGGQVQWVVVNIYGPKNAEREIKENGGEYFIVKGEPLKLVYKSPHQTKMKIRGRHHTQGCHTIVSNGHVYTEAIQIYQENSFLSELNQAQILTDKRNQFLSAKDLSPINCLYHHSWEVESHPSHSYGVIRQAPFIETRASSKGFQILFNDHQSRTHTVMLFPYSTIYSSLVGSEVKTAYDYEAGVTAILMDSRELGNYLSLVNNGKSCAVTTLLGGTPSFLLRCSKSN